MGTIVCGAGFAYDYFEPGMGADDERNFFDSELASAYADTQVWNTLQAVYEAENPEQRADYAVAAAEDGFSCVIRRADGTVAADTRREGSR